mgnify:CR=1 FL=1
MELELYSTASCHLCDSAAALLEAVVPHSKHAWQCYVVDIADDDALLERYASCIPVVVRCDSGAQLSWPFTGETLLAFLDA